MQLHSFQDEPEDQSFFKHDWHIIVVSKSKIYTFDININFLVQNVEILKATNGGRVKKLIQRVHGQKLHTVLVA